MEEYSNNHHSLNEVFQNCDFLSVLKLSSLLSAERLAQLLVLAPVQWQAIFYRITLES